MTETGEIWTQARIEQHITDRIEESLGLEYKAADSLARTDPAKKEISKDVSAMANSAGGIIMYGVAEYQDKEHKHLPEKIDPVDRTQFSREWLEQVINSNIQPRIDGIIIHPVPTDTAPNHVVYVVEIPQSATAHQAKDGRYYKRLSFQSVPMVDYEIRDVMGRRKNARIELEFKILIRTETEFPSLLGYTPFSQKREPKRYSVYELKIRMTNLGKVYAKYVQAFINMPQAFAYSRYEDYEDDPAFIPEIDLDRYCSYERDNTVRDVIKYGGGGFAPEYGPARYVPILPGVTLNVDDIQLTRHFEAIDWGEHLITWSTHADNAPPHSGEIRIKDIGIVDRRHTPWGDLDVFDD